MSETLVSPKTSTATNSAQIALANSTCTLTLLTALGEVIGTPLQLNYYCIPAKLSRSEKHDLLNKLNEMARTADPPLPQLSELPSWVRQEQPRHEYRLETDEQKVRYNDDLFTDSIPAEWKARVAKGATVQDLLDSHRYVEVKHAKNAKIPANARFDYNATEFSGAPSSEMLLNNAAFKVVDGKEVTTKVKNAKPITTDNRKVFTQFAQVRVLDAETWIVSGYSRMPR
jgi:hypothetical protein